MIRRPPVDGGPDRGLTADELVGGHRRNAPRPIRPTRSSVAPSTPARSRPATCSLPCPASTPTAIASWERRWRPGRRGARGSGRPKRWTSSVVDATVVRVEDPLRALQGRRERLAIALRPARRRRSPARSRRPRRRRPSPTVLGAAMPTLRNEGNLNNEIGLPLTVLRLRSEHRAAVLEMGMYVGGEIADLARIGRPEIGIVTAVQPVHLSRIGTIEAVEQAKGELVEALPARRCRDPQRRRRAGPPHGVADARAGPVTYGFAPKTPTCAPTRPVSRGADGMRFRLLADGEARRVTIPALGRLAVHNASGRGGGRVSPPGCRSTRSAVRSRSAGARPHRGQLVRAGGVTIVDDSYNASPASVAAALELLAGLDGRRIAVLGEMLELGDEHESGHRRIGEAAAAIADRLVVVGDGASAIADGAAGCRDAGLERHPRARSGRRPGAPDRARSGAGRRRARQGIARDRPRPARRRARWPPSGRRGPRGRDRRADPGPAPRVRDRRDPDAAVHPAAAGDGVHEADPDRGPGQRTRSSTARRRWAGR